LVRSAASADVGMPCAAAASAGAIDE